LLSVRSLVAASALSAVGLTKLREAQQQRLRQPPPGQKPNIGRHMARRYRILESRRLTTAHDAGGRQNLDKAAAEGMLFTDYYAESELHGGPRQLHQRGELPIRTGMTTVGQAGSPIGLPAQAVTIAHALKGRLRHWPIRQEPPSAILNEFLPTVHGFESSSAISIKKPSMRWKTRRILPIRRNC